MCGTPPITVVMVSLFSVWKNVKTAQFVFLSLFLLYYVPDEIQHQCSTAYPRLIDFSGHSLKLNFLLFSKVCPAEVRFCPLRQNLRATLRMINT